MSWVWLPTPTKLYVIVLGTNGSHKAEHDFSKMLENLRTTP